MKQEILNKLKEYNPQDFKDWKKTGLAEILFAYLKDKKEELRQYVLNEFDGCAISESNLADIKLRQAFASCLGAIESLTFEDIKEYYAENLTGGEKDE